MNCKRFGIMGGTFDPIHFGHLVIANEVLNIYNMDKIIFIPAGIPPHKKGPFAGSFERFLMTNIATMSNQKFEVSDIEIKSPGKSYTVNTIRELLYKHENTEFYFITGADAIIDLPNWHEPEKLLKLCKFIAVMRPGFIRQDIEEKIKEIDEKYGCNIDVLQVPMLQISSTDIRKRVKESKSIKYLLPEAVEQYIIKNNLYKNRNYEIDNLKSKLKNTISSKLYDHSLRTMETAEKLAIKYETDIEKAKVAALLHDCGKSSYKIGDDLLHAKLGAQLAKEIYNIDDTDILNAIKYHTTGREAMSLLEKIVFIADKTEHGRVYEGVDEIRNLSYKNIDEAIIKSIERTIEYIKSRNLDLDYESQKTLDYLKGGKIDNKQ